MEPQAIPAPAERLRSHGLRVTSQRRAILGVFAEPGRGHLSAEQVYDQAAAVLPELARATVYNTLNDFVGAGLLRRVDGFGSALYDHNVDEDHHHFHCLACGGLFDVEPGGVAGIELSDAGYAVERTEVLFRGRCADCSAAATS
jgi:Fe2+ or Zn2+ uptake regulation protein